MSVTVASQAPRVGRRDRARVDDVAAAVRELAAECRFDAGGRAVVAERRPRQRNGRADERCQERAEQQIEATPEAADRLRARARAARRSPAPRAESRSCRDGKWRAATTSRSRCRRAAPRRSRSRVVGEHHRARVEAQQAGDDAEKRSCDRQRERERDAPARPRTRAFRDQSRRGAADAAEHRAETRPQ